MAYGEPALAILLEQKLWTDVNEGERHTHTHIHNSENTQVRQIERQKGRGWRKILTINIH